MRVCLKALFLLSAGVLLASIGSSAHGQINLPGFGQKNAGSNDQKANALLHQHLPLDLDANSAYPTVPNEDLLGGPFRGRVLPVTLDTLTKPLPPGDYILPMTFFCSEYSIHRPGAGTAYVLAPAKGTAAKAISTLLWRGMLTGHKPQELQSVSWAIQGSVAYDKMPASYKRLVDELIPDMKNQVNGQAFADIETGFQGKVNRATKKISDAIGRGTGGYVHADIKVDVELNQSFGRLGRLGQMALDGENINSIVTNATLTDDQRTHAIYAGQGTQAPPLPAANGPWSVIIPGVAYMRFTVHGGNLQSDNMMQIRIIRPRDSSAALDTRPHLVLAQYPQSTAASPSLLRLVNGTVNQPALSQCLATSIPQAMCIAGSVDVGGLAAFSVGTGAQSPLLTVANPVSPSGITVTPRERIARSDVSPNRTTIGVGEIVDLAVSGATQTTWSVDPTSAGTISNQTAGGATFTAFDQDIKTVTISAATDQGKQSATLTIIKPDKAIWLPVQPPSIQAVPPSNPVIPINAGSPTLHPVGTCEAGAEGFYYLSPDTVSFSRVRIREENVRGILTGPAFLNRPLDNGHCTESGTKGPKPQWCGNLAIGSVIRKNVGSRESGLDIAYYHDVRTCGSLAVGAITHTIGLQFSVRKPEYPTLATPVDRNELDNDSHWGKYYTHDLPPIEQKLTLSLGRMSVRKGDAMPDIPSVIKGSETSYMACQPNDDDPRPNVEGAPDAEMHLITNEALAHTIKLKACMDLCALDSNGNSQCDTQAPQ